MPEVVLTEVNVHHNGTADPDLYSDKEDGKKKQWLKNSVMKSWIENYAIFALSLSSSQSSALTHTAVRCEN